MHSKIGPSDFTRWTLCPPAISIPATEHQARPKDGEPKPFPLFKISLNEAYLLIEARKCLTPKWWWWGHNTLLCVALESFAARVNRNERRAVNRLKSKITMALYPRVTLSSYMGTTDTARLRRDWINALLKHNRYR